MTQEFVELVRSMRRAQKAWDQHPSAPHRSVANDWERRVDLALREMADKQTGLFEEKPA